MKSIPIFKSPDKNVPNLENKTNPQPNISKPKTQVLFYKIKL